MDGVPPLFLLYTVLQRLCGCATFNLFDFVGQVRLKFPIVKESKMHIFGGVMRQADCQTKVWSDILLFKCISFLTGRVIILSAKINICGEKFAFAGCDITILNCYPDGMS